MRKENRGKENGGIARGLGSGDPSIKRFLFNTAMILFVVLWSVASYIQWAVEDRHIDYSTEGEASIGTLELQHGDVLTQEIRINRYIDGLQILMNNGGGDRAKTNHGSFRVTLSQGGLAESYEIDINGMPDWTYQDFRGSLKKFRDGTAVLTLESIDTELGSSLFFPYMQQDKYELPPAQLNGEPLAGALFLKYETGNPVPLDTSVYVVGALLFLAVLAAGVVLTWKPRDGLVYGVTVLLIFLTVCFRSPSHTIDGEMFSEVGTIYLPSVRDLGFFENLKVLELKYYMNFMGRLVSWIAVYLTASVRAAVYAIDLISLLLVSLMGAALATGVLKKYITRLESVLLSVLIVTCLVNAETMAVPVNTAYWGIIPMLVLLAAVIFETDLSNGLYWYFASLVILSTMSRMYYVIFLLILPLLYLCMTLRQHRRLRRRDWAFFAIEMSACLLQGIGSLVLRDQKGFQLTGESGFGIINLSDPLGLLEGILYGEVQSANTLLRMQPYDGFIAWNLLALAAFLGVCVFLLVCIIKNRHKHAALYAAVLLLVSAGQITMRLLSHVHHTSFVVDWNVVSAVARAIETGCSSIWVGWVWPYLRSSVSETAVPCKSMASKPPLPGRWRCVCC